MAHWDFLSTHALVLLHVLEHPRSTVREIAAAVDITERHAVAILRALEEEDIVSRQKEGRRNRYSVNLEALPRRLRQGRYSVEELAGQLRLLSHQLEQSAVSGNSVV
jgi:DNA-binding transcriptional ArsR family regulator